MNANKTEAAPASTENCTPSASAATKPLGNHAMVKQAVNALNSSKGFSRKSICSYILANGKKQMATSVIDRALSRLVKKGTLSRNKKGSYRLALKKATKSNKVKVLVAKRGRRRALSRKRASVKKTTKRRRRKGTSKSKKSKKGRKGRKGRKRPKKGKAMRRKSSIKKRRRRRRR